MNAYLAFENCQYTHILQFAQLVVEIVTPAAATV